MTPSNEHNNAPAVPQGWKLVPIEPTDAMVDAAHHAGWSRIDIYSAMLATAPAPAHCMPIDVTDGIVDAMWDLLADTNTVVRIERHQFPGVVRSLAKVLLTATPAPEPAQYKDSTPHLSVGESSFESWYDQYLLNAPVHQGHKQRARDAYAAGMGDPLVAPAPAQEVGLTDGLIERRAMTGMVDAQIEAIIAALRAKGGKL